MDPSQPALWVAVAGLSLAAAVASLTWLLLSSRRASGRLRRARESAERLLAEARRESESIRKVAALEGREELHAARESVEREAERKRQELAEQEKRLQERDANIDRKFNLVEKKDAELGVLTRELESRGGRAVSLGAVYKTLDRLEAKGYVASNFGEPTPERGGRGKRLFRVTASGRRVLRQSLAAIHRMSEGLHELLEPQ